MKTKFLLIALLLSIGVFVYAQESQTKESPEAGYKTAFKRNKSGDNWFIHFGAGGQVYFGDNDNKASFSNRVTFAPTVSLGKWFSPYWGFRLKGQGGAIHGFEDDGAFMQHDRYYNIHVDALWNLTNYWGKYSDTKSFNFTPYLGLGFAHRFQNNQSTESASWPLSHSVVNGSYERYANALSVNPGVMFGVRLSNRINLDFDLGAAIVPDYFDRVVHRAENEAIVSATAGFTVKLGKTTFETVEPMDYALIGSLNDKINSLRTERDNLAAQLPCPKCPEVQPATGAKEVNYVPNVVFFRLNSSKIDANQQISVYNTAQFMKNTGEKIKVIGYADKKTGSSKYNLGLSEKRAKAVAKELTAKYNIPSQNIVVEWKGSDEQPYPENNWNRVVIMSAQ